MKYVIVGGSGFIGTHLVNSILERDTGAEILNLDIEESTHGGRTTYFKVDVRKPIPMDVGDASVDVVFNLAAVHRTPGHPDYAYFETNIRGAENVTAWATQHGVQCIIFTSSIAPYAASEEEKYETTLPTPNTPYGISKLVAEKIHQTWQAADAAHRRLLILRPGVVFGFGENGNFTRLYWAIKRRRFAFAGRSDTIKGCIYVKDLVGFMLYYINKMEPGSQLFNCTYEPAYTIKHIVNHLKQVTGQERTTLTIPSWILIPASYVAMLLGSPMGICPARVRKLMVSTNICGKKMATSGYVMQYSFDAAVQDWLKDSGGKDLL